MAKPPSASFNDHDARANRDKVAQLEQLSKDRLELLTQACERIKELEARPIHIPSGSIDYPAWLTKLQAKAAEQVSEVIEERKAATESIAKLRSALQMVLLFHTVGLWTGARRADWLQITGSGDATTKVLCDHVRKVLDE